MTDRKNVSGKPPFRGSRSEDDADRRKEREGDAGDRKPYGARDNKNASDRQNLKHGEEAADRPRGPGGAAGALIELDRELMKLLVRRATLVSRIRGGKEHASSPAAVQAEKAVRIAWETGALSFSKDPRFSRQLFSLLQDIRILGKEEAEKSGSFTLKPQREPVSGVVAGPTSTRAAQMRLALSAFLGKSLRLDPLMISAPLLDAVKACEQAGASITLGGKGPARSHLKLEPGRPLSFDGKSLFLGDDAFSAYLFIFLSLGQTGVRRLNGGSGLKALDLTSLRLTLPLFGARLAHVVPHTNGFPVNLECSGLIPPHVLVPAELPEEALCALLLAPLVWNVPVTLDLSALPAASATAALAEVRPLHRDSGAEVDSYGPRLTFAPSALEPPTEPALPLDPALTAYLLALPAFTGGSLQVRGIWPADMPEAAEARQLFAWAGLDCRISEDGISAAMPAADGAEGKSPKPPFSLPMQCSDISPSLGPLFLALSALCLKKLGSSVPLQALLNYPEDEDDCALAAEFFDRLGMRYEEGLLEAAPEKASSKPDVPSWTSPGLYWSLAYALAAFLRPGLELANPTSVSTRMPLFWTIYNSLPEASDTAKATKSKEEAGSGGTARRRVIAD